jgi:hypothetical protein
MSTLEKTRNCEGWYHQKVMQTPAMLISSSSILSPLPIQKHPVLNLTPSPSRHPTLRKLKPPDMVLYLPTLSLPLSSDSESGVQSLKQNPSVSRTPPNAGLPTSNLAGHQVLPICLLSITHFHSCLSQIHPQTVIKLTKHSSAHKNKVKLFNLHPRP